MRRAVARSDAGNVYVNRNMIGAVVGVQPFGGTGLSGTGPKAGGPLMLHRLRRGAGAARLLAGEAPEPARRLLARLEGHSAALACRALLERSPFGAELVLPGPVGEQNLYNLRPRGGVLCVASDEAGLLLQVMAALATGNRAVVRRPHGVAALDGLVTDAGDTGCAVALVDAASLPALAAELAARDGAIVPLHRLDANDDALPLEWLMHERSVSINTTAAGGNASLMTLV